MLTDEDFAFIHCCENNMTYRASQMAINNFNEKRKFNYFQTIADIVHGVTNNKFYSYQFAEMVAAADKQKLFINSLITFANLLVNIYSFSIFQKLWYSIKFNNDIIKSNESNDNKPLAVTKLKKNGHYLAQCMIISGRTLQEHVNKKQYEIGFHSTSDNISTIIHEIGHAIANYALVWPPDRIYFNHNINADTGQCICESSSDRLNIRTFITNPGDLLVQYLGHQVGISNNAPFQQQLAAWAFIQSGYGRTINNDELFAEGFAQWMLTPDEQKGLNWEILNEFYTTYFKNYYCLN
ncbi:hypothetical protein [Spiroplasma sp. ChiS]|uniref:hypothetical protein n=1 Tax=Spiroplasma sp. ChiS TaxID=2099885 RepID=UPI001F1FFCEA|nr:hypothetical protein [Spiroplasma sp. ChiS]